MTSFPSCTEYMTSIEVPKLIKAKELQGGKVVTKNGKPLRYAGGFCVVFPYQESTGKKVAVRCWTAHVKHADRRCRQISKRLQESGLSYFVRFDYVEQGVATQLGVFPIIIMDWVDATPLKNYLQNNINNSSAIKALADKFLRMTNDLHKLGFSHGDLQHGNIMVSSSGELFLVDYDSMYVPGLEYVTDDIKGLIGYQHPGRAKLKYLSPKSDYFSELIIYTSLLVLAKYPFLWKDLNIEDTETLVFAQEDLDNPSQSAIFHILRADDELFECADAIEEALLKSDIEDLLPLNEAIIPKSVKITDGLHKKWETRFVPQSVDSIFDTYNLKEKWNKRRLEEHVIATDVCSITTKWK